MRRSIENTLENEMPDKFKKSERSFSYSKLYIFFMFVGLVGFGTAGLGLIFGIELSKPDSVSQLSHIADAMVDYPVFRVGCGIFMLLISLLFFYALYYLFNEKRPYLLFSSDGLVISNLSPKGFSPIPWDAVKGYEISKLPYSFLKSLIILDVQNYQKYTKPRFGKPAAPAIMMNMCSGKLKDVTVVLDSYIENIHNTNIQKGEYHECY